MEFLEGFDSLMRELDQLTFRQGEQGLSLAARRGAKLLQEEEEHLVPRASGTLAANIKVRIVERSATEVIAEIGPGKRAFYAQFQNWGTRFQKAHHFVERSWDNRHAEALAVMRYELGRFIDRALKNG